MTMPTVLQPLPQGEGDLYEPITAVCLPQRDGIPRRDGAGTPYELHGWRCRRCGWTQFWGAVAGGHLCAPMWSDERAETERHALAHVHLVEEVRGEDGQPLPPAAWEPGGAAAAMGKGLRTAFALGPARCAHPVLVVTQDGQDGLAHCAECGRQTRIRNVRVRTAIGADALAELRRALDLAPTADPTQAAAAS